MSEWESQIVAITKALDRIEIEVKENRNEVIKLNITVNFLSFKSASR